MSAEKAAWDGVERRKADAPLGLTALNIAARIGNEGGSTFDPAQARKGDFDNSNLQGRVETILTAALTEPESTEPEAAPQAPEKVLTADQKGAFVSKLQARVVGDESPRVRRVLDAMDERSLYGLFMMEDNGHEVGIKSEERGGLRGFRFDSCSAESPKNIRDVDYFQAEDMAEKDWGVPLMPPEVFNELRRAGVITNSGTWDHLKTASPGTREKPGLSWYGVRYGADRYAADAHSRFGGFRCSLWAPEV